MNDTQRKQRTITLTDRSPVKIYEDEWPVLAHGEWEDYDNQYEFQANRKAEAHVRVRQGGDGRHIIYGTYRYTSQFQNEYDCHAAAGKLLDGGWNEPAVIEAIHAVTDSLSSYDSLPDVTWQPDWRKLADDCIADLPAEEL